MATRALPRRPRSLVPEWRRVPAGTWALRGTAALYLGLIIALPLGAVVTRGFGAGLTSLRDAVAAPGALNAIKLTLVTAVATAALNAVLGTLIAYVLVRYRFAGRAMLSALVDLPFAIPTLVTGVMLVALYGPASPVGAYLKAHGVQIGFAPLGVLVVTRGICCHPSVA